MNRTGRIARGAAAGLAGALLLTGAGAGALRASGSTASVSTAGAAGAGPLSPAFGARPSAHMQAQSEATSPDQTSPDQTSPEPAPTAQTQTPRTPAVPASVTAAEQEATLPGTGVDPLHAPFDKILDVYVREGFVYYRALKAERARFDRYVDSLDVAPATYEKWPREQQLAFWINAYNAFVLETVIDHYPIRGRGAAYPANSIRNVPGAFDKLPHRAAGRSLTLDEIEKTVLPAFKEPQAYLALGRGSIGGGRLRSEAYTSARLDAQLADTGKECVGRKECVQLDEGAATLSVSPLFSWREAQFAETLGQAEMESFPGRSPIERAVLRLIEPHILPNERVFLRQNRFAVKFGTYDWRLNDLTGGMPER